MKRPVCGVALAILLVGCGSTTSTAPENVTVTSTSVRAIHGDELFEVKLKEAGIIPLNDEGLQSLIPLAQSACRMLQNSSAPRDKRFSNTVKVMQALGGDSDKLFGNTSRTSDFLEAAIAAYCPSQADLIP